MCYNYNEVNDVKNITSTFIIDEMIEKLTKLKANQSDRFVVEQLHVIRAYCDLLLKSYEKHAEEAEPVKKPASTPPKSTVPGMPDDEKLDSIFDF